MVAQLKNSFDVCIVGRGLAGATVALSLPSSTRVAICSTGDTPASRWIKGGIAAALDTRDIEIHYQDTLKSGCGLSDPEAARVVAEQAPSAMDFLKGLGVELPELELEGGHRASRVRSFRGDQTGLLLMERLEAVLAASEITQLTATLVQIITDDNGLVGAIFRDSKGNFLNLSCAHLVLATGGATSLWPAHTTPNGNTGVPMYLAYEAGATLRDLEFVQFHPTAIAVGSPPFPLATEALRGAGAKLIDETGERFMVNIDQRAELATRDIVARAVDERSKNARTYLDCRSLTDLQQRFPYFVTTCAEHGLDPTTDVVPVTAAAHYFIGGIATDLYGRTGVPGLWAVGECASTGLHGANRLASNSTAEALVIGRRLAIAVDNTPRAIRPVSTSAITPDLQLMERRDSLGLVGKALASGAGITRDEASSTCALELLDQATPDPVVDLARMILAAAIERKTSVGAHYRTDALSNSQDGKTFMELTFTKGQAPRWKKRRSS